LPFYPSLNNFFLFIKQYLQSQAPTADGDSDTHFVVCGRKGFCWFENSEKNEEKSGSDSGLADKSDNSDHGSGDISHKSWSWSRPSNSLDDSGSGSADGSADSSDDDDSSSFPADNSELHEVRCCSDVQLPGWSKKFWCDVYAKSVFDKQCFHKKNYTTAEAICTDNNGRLCTKEELEQNCAAGTGCGHDFDFIWSSTPSDPTEMPTVVPSKLPSVSPSVIPSISLLPSLTPTLPPSSAPSLSNAPSLSSSSTPSYSPSVSKSPSLSQDEYFFGVCGRRGFCLFEEEKEYPVDSEHEVRCCANTRLDSSFKKRRNCSVWASSRIDGSCLYELNHSEAEAACSSIGARLCTALELKKNCARGTGCGFDNNIIWTSTPGSPNDSLSEDSKIGSIDEK